MKIGEVRFEDGECIQGWNPQAMSPAIRKQIATELEDIASHMRRGKFREGEKYVTRPYKKKARA
jgi:hypothetical protein